jgi:hypothetical protein
MCQSFSLGPLQTREDYVYCSDGRGLGKHSCPQTSLPQFYASPANHTRKQIRGQGKFSRRVAAFEKLARNAVPTLDDMESGDNRSFWRLTLGYLQAMTGTENVRPFRSPRGAEIDHSLCVDLTQGAHAK